MAEQLAVQRLCRGKKTIEKARANLEPGPHFRARAGRTPISCGWDFNEEVLHHPPDGAAHESTCPHCGAEIKWSSPRYLEPAEAEEE
jgi:hypothetical protein